MGEGPKVLDLEGARRREREANTAVVDLRRRLRSRRRELAEIEESERDVPASQIPREQRQRKTELREEINESEDRLRELEAAHVRSSQALHGVEQVVKAERSRVQRLEGSLQKLSSEIHRQEREIEERERTLDTARDQLRELGERADRIRDEIESDRDERVPRELIEDRSGAGEPL